LRELGNFMGVLEFGAVHLDHRACVVKPRDQQWSQDVGRTSQTPSPCFLFTLGLRNFLKRGFLDSLFAKIPKDGVAGDLIKPGRDRGLAAEAANSSKDGRKDILSEILSLDWVFHHAKADTVDTLTVAAMEAFERRGVALPGQAQLFAF